MENVGGKVIVSCDTDFVKYRRILEETSDLERVAGYKIGCELGLNYNLPRVMEMSRHYLKRSDSEKIFIFDQQSGGNDTREMGKRISGLVRDAGFDMIIFKPKRDNLKNLRDHIHDAQDLGLDIMVVGKMTHEDFDSVLSYEMAYQVYRTAFESGVRNFGVPSNNVHFMDYIKSGFKRENIIYFPIGIGTQKGKIEDAKECLKGSPICPIIGSAIYNSNDIRQAAMDYISKL